MPVLSESVAMSTLKRMFGSSPIQFQVSQQISRILRVLDLFRWLLDENVRLWRDV